jgi:hypothetical protein
MCFMNLARYARDGDFLVFLFGMKTSLSRIYRANRGNPYATTIDVRDHRKCRNQIASEFAARLQMNRDAALRHLRRNVDVSPDKEQGTAGSLGSFLGGVIDLTIVSSRKFSVVCSRIDMSICSCIRN